MNKAERLAQDGITDTPILFYRGDDPEYGYMSSFSRFAIVMPHPWLDGHPLATYETREHYFQACKAINLEDHEWVRTASGPSETKRRGRAIKLRDDWGNAYGDPCWYVMVESIFAVCFQHIEVAEALVGYQKPRNLRG